MQWKQVSSPSPKKFKVIILQGLEKPEFFKKAQLGWVLLGFGFYWFFWMHSASGCLNKHGNGK